MKKEYKTPLTEIVYINIGTLLGDEYGDPSQDSTGDTPGQSPDIVTNSFGFDESEVDNQGGKSLWDD